MKSETEVDSLRSKTLEVVRRHKASWIELGQYLYTIHREKRYRNWGFVDFETYCAKELHLKHTTAVKLLRSYYFLEQENPQLVTAGSDGSAPQSVPSYEAVNVLRLAANNKKLTSGDIQHLKEAVLELEKDPKDVRAQMKKMLSQREEKDPADARRERRNTTIKRLVTILSNSKNELENDHLLPVYLLKQISDLVSKLNDQLE